MWQYGQMIILGIETSCDETAISVVKAEGGLEDLRFEVLGSALHSQVKMHEEFGGVVPMLAKREHIKNLPPVLIEALRKANLIFNSEFSIFNSENPGIDMITVTVGPGLEPALWTGIKFAEELGQKWQVPVIPANHMLGHIASVLFELESTKAQVKKRVEFPAVALLVSGGHTELINIKSWAEMEKVGETKDDAVGEAFDKVARMLGLPYPGGPQISALAEKARQESIQQENKFPRPMLHSKDLNFSFSGLKTSVLYYIKNLRNTSENISQVKKLEIAREFEDAVIETLLTKTKMAIEKYDPKTLIIGGGVIANKALRENFLKLKEIYPDLEILIPEKSLTTDNATMIAAAGFIEYLKGGKETELKANGNLDIN